MLRKIPHYKLLLIALLIVGCAEDALTNHTHEDEVRTIKVSILEKMYIEHYSNWVTVYYYTLKTSAYSTFKI